MRKQSSLIFLLFLLSATSIMAKGATVELDKLEKEISCKPDSVLAILNDINPQELRGRESKARYALLLSQALDKNGMDIKSDSLISPAVRYYSRRGTPDRRLRMNYYRGRIAENSGNPDEAMEWFKKGEEYVPACSDYATAGRLYSHKSVLYYNIFDYNDALSNAKISSDFFLKAADTLNFSYRSLDIAGILLLCNNPTDAEKSIESLPEFFDVLPSPCKAQYFNHKIDAALMRKNSEDTSALLEECLMVLPDLAYFPSLEMTIARAQLFCDRPEESLSLLESCKEHDSSFSSSPSFHLLLSEVQAALGNYEEALKEYKANREINREMAKAALESDTKFVEEKYEAGLRDK